VDNKDTTVIYKLLIYMKQSKLEKLFDRKASCQNRDSYKTHFLISLNLRIQMRLSAQVLV